MKNNLVPWIVLVMVASGCVDVIDLDLNDSDAMVVIDGRVSDTGIVEVKITTSIPVKSPNEFPPITNAEVEIADVTSGETVVLEQSFPGIYRTTMLTGTPGHTYQMTVKIGDDVFFATSQMPHLVKIDDLAAESAQRFGSDETYRLIASYNDPVDPGNNYRYIIYQNGVQSQWIFVRNDSFTNGNHVDQSVFNPEIKIVSGDQVSVEMQCIDEAVFNYFNGLMLLNTDRGISPTNPQTNIDGGALGYFSAYTSSELSISID